MALMLSRKKSAGALDTKVHLDSWAEGYTRLSVTKTYDLSTYNISKLLALSVFGSTTSNGGVSFNAVYDGGNDKYDEHTLVIMPNTSMSASVSYTLNGSTLEVTISQVGNNLNGTLNVEFMGV